MLAHRLRRWPNINPPCDNVLQDTYVYYVIQVHMIVSPVL